MAEMILRTTHAGALMLRELYQISHRAVRAGLLDPPRYRPKTEAQKKEHRDGIARKNCVLRVNATFGSKSYLVTLTYDAEHYAGITLDQIRKDRDNWIRCVKRLCPGIVIFAVCGEGEEKGRYHIHVLLTHFETKFIKPIKDKWTKGKPYVQTVKRWNYQHGIRVKTDLTPIAIYMFEQGMRINGGHRYYLSRNSEKPSVDHEAVDKLKISHQYQLEAPPEVKGYECVMVYMTSYGFRSFWYLSRVLSDPLEELDYSQVLEPAKNRNNTRESSS